MAMFRLTIWQLVALCFGGVVLCLVLMRKAGSNPEFIGNLQRTLSHTAQKDAAPPQQRQFNKGEELLKARTQAEVDAFAKIKDRTERLKAIVDSMPEPVWPSTLPYGFEWITPKEPPKPITTAMTPAEAETEFTKLMQRYQIKCPTQVRYGIAELGGWHVCVAPPYNFGRPCLVYSIGLGGEWSFDRQIMDKNGCADMGYDPTLGKTDHKPYDLMWFNNAGLGGINGLNAQNWKLRTFARMLEENGQTEATVDILKVDVEYSEWEAFEVMLLDGSLRRVKQFMFEYHTEELNKKTSVAADYVYYMLIFRGLEKLGFKYWTYEYNWMGDFVSPHTKNKVTCCGNMYFVNVNYLV